MAEVKKKAEILAQAILESEEYENLREIGSKVTADEEAHAILKKYDAQQQKIHRAQHQGQQIGSEERERMQELKKKMEQNPKLKQLLKAQDKFNDLMDSVFRVINNAVQGITSCCGHDCDDDCC